MDDISMIDIEGKRLAYTLKDIDQLAAPDGCTLQVSNTKVYDLDDANKDIDDTDSDAGDFPSGNHDSPNHSLSKEDRMKREYISLVLNTNRDPIKPATQSKMRRLFADDTDDPDAGLKLGQIEEIECEYRALQKRYAKLGNYEDCIANKENAYEEISPGRVFKRLLRPGAAPAVDNNSMVVYNCAFWTENSAEPFDSTWLRRKTNLNDMADDSILPGLMELLLTSRSGEWCEAFIRPEAAFGKIGVLPRIPPNATIFCLLEVVKVLPKDRVSQLTCNPHAAKSDSSITFDDLYEVSDEARTRGNHFYELKQYRAALQRYKSGIRILEAVSFKDEQEEKKAQALLVKLYNNTAKAANASGDPRLALAACKQAHLLNRMEPKTYWNRMTAWKRKGHLDKALGVARRAMDLFPDKRTRESFAREANELKKRLQTEQTELDELHRLMGRAISGTNQAGD